MTKNLPYPEVVAALKSRKREVIRQRVLPIGVGPPQKSSHWLWMPIDAEHTFERERYEHPQFGPHFQSRTGYYCRRDSIKRICPIYELRLKNGFISSEIGWLVNNMMWELEQAGLEFFLSRYWSNGPGENASFIFLNENDAVLGTAALSVT